MKIEQAGDFRLRLGEGPVWDVGSQSLYLVDSFGQEVLRYDPAADAAYRWRFDHFVGSLAVCDKGLVLALGSGIHLFDVADQRLTLVGDPEADDPVTQLNDGKTDRFGRFLTGSVATDMAGENCGLYSVDRGKITKLDGGFGLTNGPCFSPAGDIFYFADSRRQTIYAYDYDATSGQVANRRVFASTIELGGIPDGATVDSEGRLWSAICGGGVLACWRPTGVLERTIAMPTPLVSSVMFGGPALDTLYVTSINASKVPFVPGDHDDGIAGALFAVSRLDVRGLPEARYVV